MPYKTELSYQWQVGPWESLPNQTGHSIQSPIFTESTLSTEWRLEVFPAGTEKEPDFIALYLLSKSRGELSAMCVFALLDSQGNRLHVIQPHKPCIFSMQLDRFGYEHYMSHSLFATERQRILTDGFLNIHCQVYIEDYKPSESCLPRFHFSWSLCEFMQLDDDVKMMKSSLHHEPKTSTDWAMIVYPNGKYSKDVGYVSLRACYHNGNTGVKAKVILALKDTKGHLISTMQYSFNFSDLYVSYGYDKFISRDMLMKHAASLLPNGTLTLFCEVEILEFDPNPIWQDTSLILSVDKFLELNLTPGTFVQTPDSCHANWHLRVYPKGLPGNDEKYVALQLLPKLPGRVSGMALSFLIDSAPVNAGINTKQANSFIWPKFVLRDTLQSQQSSLLPDGKFTVKCHFDKANFVPDFECVTSEIQFEKKVQINLSTLSRTASKGDIFYDPSGASQWSLAFEKSTSQKLICSLYTKTPGIEARISVAMVDGSGRKLYLISDELFSHVQSTYVLCSLSLLDKSGWVKELEKINLVVVIEIVKFANTTYSARVLETNSTFTACSFDYLWKINNFASLSFDVGTYVESPVFTDPSQCTQWVVQLYPSGISVEDRIYIAVYLCSKSSGLVKAGWTCAVLSFDGEHEFPKVMQPEMFESNGQQPKGWARFVHRNFLTDLSDKRLPDEALSLRITIELFEFKPDLQPNFDLIIFEHLWHVPARFDSLGSDMEYTDLFVDPTGQTQWSLTFYPNASGPENQGYLSAMLCLTSPDQVVGKRSLAIMDGSGNKWFASRPTHSELYHKDSPGEAVNLLAYNTLLQHSDMLLPEDELSVWCEIHLMLSSPKMIYPKPCLYSLRSGLHSDLILEVEDKEFPVHRVVLGAVSPMLNHLLDKAEFNNNRFKLPTNMPPHLVKHALDFIYETVDDLYTLDLDAAIQLLRLADQLNIKPLKQAAQRRLASLLSLKTLNKIESIAKEMAADNLLSYVKQYMETRAHRKFLD